MTLGWQWCFLVSVPAEKPMKETIDRLDFIKVKNFFSTKVNAKWMRRQAKDWENMLVKDTYDKRLTENIQNFTENIYLNNKKGNILLKSEPFNRYLMKKDIASKPLKRYLTSYVTRELQIKIKWGYHYIPIRTAKILKSSHTKCWQRQGTTGILILLVEMQNGIASLEVTYVIS